VCSRHTTTIWKAQLEFLNTGFLKNREPDYRNRRDNYLNSDLVILVPRRINR
jgi:hypothetical protein